MATAAKHFRVIPWQKYLRLLWLSKIMNIIDRCTEFAKANPNIDVLWLYGSRAKGTACASRAKKTASAACGPII